MTEGLTGIIAQLERQKTAIERALAALREVDGLAAPTSPIALAAPAARKNKAKNRRSEGQRARWAAKKAAEATSTPAPAKATRKGGMTEGGRKRLADAMKERWAVKRAGSAVKKGAGRPKKAA